jgi:hypothetical protein
MELVDCLESQVEDTVKIPWDRHGFPYVVLKLLNQGKDSVICKSCSKQYQSKDLRPFTLGAGESPLKVARRVP